MENKPTILFAIDIETTGCILTLHKIVALGYCAIDFETGKIILKKRINFKLDDINDVSSLKDLRNVTDREELKKRLPESIEPKCWAEHWAEHLDQLKIFQTEDPQSPEDGIRHFVEDLDNMDSEYKVAIITDNPSFDITFINYYLSVYLLRRPIAYMLGGEGYRSIFDTDSYTRGVLGKDYSCLWTFDSEIINKLEINLDSNIVHDHMPENDAEYIAQLHRKIVLISNE